MDQDIVVDMTNMNAGARAGASKGGRRLRLLKRSRLFSLKMTWMMAEELLFKPSPRARAAEAKRHWKSKTIPAAAFDRMFKAFQKIDPSEGFDEVISVDNREALTKLANGST